MTIQPVNLPFYRRMISHQAAVRTILQIADELQGGHVYFDGYESGKSGEYDREVQNMVQEIKELKRDREKLRNLQTALKDIC